MDPSNQPADDQQLGSDSTSFRFSTDITPEEKVKLLEKMLQTIKENSEDKDIQIEELKDNLKKRFVRINELEKIEDDKDRRLAEICGQLKQKDKTIDELETIICDKEDRLRQVNGKSKAKENEIKKLEDDIDRKETRIWDLSGNVRILEDENGDLLSRLNTKELLLKLAAGVILVYLVILLVNMPHPQICPDMEPLSVEIAILKINITDLNIKVRDCKSELKLANTDLEMCLSESNITKPEVERYHDINSDLKTCRLEKDAMQRNITKLEVGKGKVSLDLTTCKLENDAVQRNITKLEAERDSIKTDLATCKLENSELQRNIADLKSERDTGNNSALETCELKIDALQSNIADLKSKRDTSNNAALETCKLENSKLQRYIADLKSERDTSNNAALETCELKIDALQQNISQLEAEKGDISANLETCKSAGSPETEKKPESDISKKLKTCRLDKKDLERKIDEEKMKSSKLKSEKEQLENTVTNLKDKKTGNPKDKIDKEKEHLQRDNQDLKHQLKTLTEKLTKLDVEIKNLQERLSECSEDPKENPFDLLPEDLVRDSRTLFEQYYALAYDEVEVDIRRLDMKQSVKFLLELFQTACMWTEHNAVHHIVSMKNSTLYLKIEIPDDELQGKHKELILNSNLLRKEWKTFYELRMASGYRMLESVTKELTELLAKAFGVDTNGSQPKTVTYIKHCLSLCWRANLLREPVFIDFYEPEYDAEFDIYTYEPFLDQQGNYMDYLVWPPIYKRRGGSLLSKGNAARKGKS